MPKDEKYHVDIGDEGEVGLEILDYLFNSSTQQFLLNNALKPDLKVLEIGCGIGTMSVWIAEKLGEKGAFLGIDNNINQVKASECLAEKHQLTNTRFLELSAYDIKDLNDQFDLIYCRFVLHHLNEPDAVIAAVYELLKPQGVFISEEGICSSGFSFPPNPTFEPTPDDGTLPDKNIGKKLFYKLKRAGFKVKDLKIQSPLLVSREEKKLLLFALENSKRMFLDGGKSEDDWLEFCRQREKLVNDDDSIVGFYASCQAAAIKE